MYFSLAGNFENKIFFWVKITYRIVIDNSFKKMSFLQKKTGDLFLYYQLVEKLCLITKKGKIFL